jgi:hypothetical protein
MNLPGHEEGIKPLQHRNDAKGIRDKDTVPTMDGLSEISSPSVPLEIT